MKNVVKFLAAGEEYVVPAGAIFRFRAVSFMPDAVKIDGKTSVLQSGPHWAKAGSVIAATGSKLHLTGELVDVATAELVRTE